MHYRREQMQGAAFFRTSLNSRSAVQDKMMASKSLSLMKLNHFRELLRLLVGDSMGGCHVN